MTIKTRCVVKEGILAHARFAKEKWQNSYLVAN
jgi:hypothetical protein